MACQKGNVDIIEFFLENGANVNKQGPQYLSPLHIAIYQKQLPACELILDKCLIKTWKYDHWSWLVDALP
jgi:ankyrin repeat protein